MQRAQWGAGGSVGCWGLSRVQGAHWVLGGTRDMQQQGEQGWTDLHYRSIPKTGEGLCVSPTLYPSLTPWPGCSLGLANPQRHEMGPPRWCKQTGWPLDLCFHPLVPSAPCTWWLELSHPPPCLSFPSQPLWGHQPPHFQAGLSPPNIRAAAGRCCRPVCSGGGSERGKEKQLCPRPQAAATQERGAPMGGMVRDLAK